ncbi:MAG: hypothetical protein DRG55_07415 [Deltaproteobacteria bacterium]|nr:MAG: hypothetical protein DRG55_07415 [Deltaproteobacteria bacterium]
MDASVSPNRRDWEAELEYVLTQTEAVLIKWIPSVQHIDLRDERHREFYRALTAHHMPLLCHVGPEYSFPEGIRRRELDDFKIPSETPRVRGQGHRCPLCRPCLPTL